MPRMRLAVVLGTSVAGLLLAGCSSTTTTTTPSTSAAVPSPPASSAAAGEGYTAEIEAQFVSNCVTSASAGGTSKADAEAICGCVYRGVETKIPFEDFLAADESAASGGELPQEIATITQSCQQDPEAF